MQNDFVNYLISWLLDDQLMAEQVVYSSNPADWKGKRLAIRPSDFFNDGVFLTRQTLVESVKHYLPSRGWIDGMEDVKYIPVLFGTSALHEENGTKILDADLIASTFYLVTRYEELVNPNRDEYGRFPAVESWLMRVGMIQYPIVDEYTDYLRSLLGLEVKPRKMQKINLTHDVDTIEFYRHLRGFVGGLCRGQFKQVFAAQKGLQYDAAYTFPWLLEQDAKVANARQIYFIKAGASDKSHDYPMYNLKCADAQTLFNLLKSQEQISFGLHCSYASGVNPGLIADEIGRLQQALGCNILSARYHYLRTTGPDDFQTLNDLGITDDYTMGFAQQAGFRLGTCRPVRWINPRTKQLTNLTLHPLTTMDNSLSDYMKLDAEDSFRYVRDLIDQTAYHRGELNLLWHNSIFAHQPWQKDLYTRLLNYISE